MSLTDELNDVLSRPALDFPLHAKCMDKVGDPLSSSDAIYEVDLGSKRVRVRPAQEHGSLYFIDQFDSAIIDDMDGFVRFLGNHYVEPDFDDITAEDVYDFKFLVPRLLVGAVGIATLEHYDKYEGDVSVRYIN